MAHRHQGPTRQPLYTMADTWEWPKVLPQAFNIIDTELALIATELKE